MPADVIEQARAHRSARESQLAEHLAKVERDMQALDHEHRLAARERETLAETAAKLHAREQELRNREETFRRKLDERIDERLRDARREIDAVRRRAEDQDRRACRRSGAADGAAADSDRGNGRGPGRGAGGNRGHWRTAARRLRKRPPPWPLRPNRAAQPAVGDRVLVGAFGLEGVVQALHDREAEVDVRGKRLRARVDELRVLTPAAALQAQPGARARERRPAAARRAR